MYTLIRKHSSDMHPSVIDTNKTKGRVCMIARGSISELHRQFPNSDDYILNTMDTNMGNNVVWANRFVAYKPDNTIFFTVTFYVEKTTGKD